MKKRRVAALLSALLVAGSLMTIPALATEGETPPSGYTDMPQENTGAPETDPEPQPPVEEPDPPVEEPSSSTPEEPPESSTPTDSSSSTTSEPSDTESQDPNGSSTPEEPVSSLPESGLEEPVSSSPLEGETVEEPSQTYSESEDTTGGGTVQEVPQVNPEPIATPRPALERPQASLNTQDDSQSTAEEESTGPNYVTFARLNVQGNSLASTLLLAGVGCIAAGVLGLAAILVFYIRGRRRYAGAEGILEEIQQAEARQHQAPPAQDRIQPQEPPVPQRPTPPPGAVMPQEVSLYTEEFSLPPEQNRPYDPDDSEGAAYGAYREDYPQDAYYDEDYASEEDYYPEEEDYNSQVYDPEDYYPEDQDSLPPQPAQRPYQAPTPQQQATQTFDTEEILREALGYPPKDSQR